MADRQIHPFNKSRVEPSRKAQSPQGSFEISLCPQAHHWHDSHQLAPPVAFFHLAVDQPRCYLPLAYFPPSPTHLKPLSKMGSESIEIHIQTITGEERKAARSQELSQGVDNPKCHVLCAGTEMEHGHKLRERIDGQPEPEHLCGAAQPGAQFVQLEVREPQIAERALVQGLCVLASASQKGS